MNSYYVYVFQEDRKTRTAPIKVGVSRNIVGRLKSVQNGNPRKLLVRLQFGPMNRAQAYDFEGHLHREISQYRLRGEWFSGKALKKITE